MTRILFLLSSIVLTFSTGAQFNKNTYQDKVKEYQVNEAIDKGAKWLLEKVEIYLKEKKEPHKDDHIGRGLAECEELALYALIHAGITEENKTFKNLFEKVFCMKPDKKKNYHVVLEIMSLVSYDKVRFQERIAECAQVLVNRQCKHGQWSYGTTFVTRTPLRNTKEILPPKDSKKVLKKISIKREHWSSEKGDNSNSQYVALGLRAASEAGIEIDPEVVKLGKQAWEQFQLSDGGWDYYQEKNLHHRSTVGSMTVGGLAALVAYNQILKEDPKKDPYVKKAIEWITKFFTVQVNPNPYAKTGSSGHHYYYLYGLERASSLASIEKFGSRNWYQEGAAYLLRRQWKDGSWNGSYDTFLRNNPNSRPRLNLMFDSPIDTSFAILFLKKATEDLATPQ